MNTLLRLRLACQQVRIIVQRIIEGPGPQPCVAGIPDVHFPFGNELQTPTLADLFLLQQQAPKKRKSRERRKTARFGKQKMEKVKIRKDIIPCWECGNWMQVGCLCTHCYEKVKQETTAMMEKMGDILRFNVPQSEVIFKYDDENPEDFNTKDSSKNNKPKMIVEMQKQRPQWFTDALLKKKS